MSRGPTHATPDGHAYLSLQRLARQSRRNTQELIRLYALEGFLARLASSPYRDQLILKGGVLMAAYGLRRPTRDVDLQAQGVPNDLATVLTLIRRVAMIDLLDGLRFDVEAAGVETIRDDDAYHGVRVSFAAGLATAQVALHVDVNVGDPIWPDPSEVTLPGLLGRDVTLPGYPIPMVHAEKLVTAMERGTTNTRWRDFADVYALSGQHAVRGDQLKGSIDEVARYREVAIAPLGPLLDGWAVTNQTRWSAWRRKQSESDRLPEAFPALVGAVTQFADAVLSGDAVGAAWDPIGRNWRRASVPATQSAEA